MAVKHLLTSGLGLSPGSVKYLLTFGLETSPVVPEVPIVPSYVWKLPAQSRIADLDAQPRIAKLPRQNRIWELE